LFWFDKVRSESQDKLYGYHITRDETMKFLRLTILYQVLIFTAVCSQPDPEWVHHYDFGDYENLLDIYATTDGGYVACGSTKLRNVANDPSSDHWIVRVSQVGDRVWFRSYGIQDVREYLTTIIETDEGGFLAGGFTVGQGMTALLTDADGEEIWTDHYGGGVCRAIIELKSGEFLLAGSITIDDNTQGYLVCINNEGDVIWSGDYEGGARDVFYAMRETAGGIMVVGHSWRSDEPHQVWMVKVDFGGDVIFSNLIEVGPSPLVRDMVSDGQNGFAIVGFDADNCSGLLIKTDNAGEMDWHQYYRWRGDRVGQFQSINRFNDGGYALVGCNMSSATIFRVEPGGNEIWNRIYGVGSHFFFSSVTSWDQATIAAGRAPGDHGDTDGLIMKLIPERSVPIIIDYIPDEPDFTTLPDTVLFAVYAIDLQLDTLLYTWEIGEDTLSTDTTLSVIFDELGDYDVSCEISDGDLATSIAWNVHVRDFFIRDCSPDSFDICIRRGLTIDFSVDAASADGEDVVYNWMLTNRNREVEEIGNADSVSVSFTEAGEHELDVTVTFGEVSEEGNWLIDVRSAIWSWWPSELELTAYVDSTLDFAITPFNEHSDSLEYIWLLDNVQLETDTSNIELTFPEPDQHQVTSIVNDGIESDTIRWTVDVREWSFATDLTDLADLPTSPVLYPASPNPFNSSVKLSVYLPCGSHVMLSVFDINGRDVYRLVDGYVSVGNQSFVWNASAFPVGVYFVRMDIGGFSKTGKLVLMR